VARSVCLSHAFSKKRQPAKADDQKCYLAVSRPLRCKRDHGIGIEARPGGRTEMRVTTSGGEADVIEKTLTDVDAVAAYREVASRPACR
jgi:hypothetical protein